MLKQIVLAILALLPAALPAQSTYTIKGYGKLYNNGDSIFLSYKQGEKHVVKYAVVKNNSFSFKGTLKSICKGYLCRNDNPANATILHDYFDVYLEPGNILLRSADTLNNSVISGTPLNRDNAALAASLHSITAEYSRIKAIEDFTPEELSDTALVRSVNEQLSDLYNKAMPVRLEFINRHPASYVSLVNLGMVARSSIFLPEVEKSFAAFPARLKALPEGKEIARRIAEGHKTFTGMMARDFMQPDVNGRPVNLSDFKGNYVLVDFWASWCAPCRAENPNLIAAYKKYGGEKFKIVSISIDRLKDRQKWLDAIRADQLPWTQLSDLKEKNEAALLYGITSVPANILIGPDGKVIGKDLKGKELQARLANIFK